MAAKFPKLTTLASDDDVRKVGDAIARAAVQDAHSAEPHVNKWAIGVQSLVAATCSAMAGVTAKHTDTSAAWALGGTITALTAPFIATVSAATDDQVAFAKQMRLAVKAWKKVEFTATGDALRQAVGQLGADVQAACLDHPGNCHKSDDSLKLLL